MITGTLTDGDGGSWPLTGTLEEGILSLRVGGLPGTSTCSHIGFNSGQFERTISGTVVAIIGFMSGRWFGTVANDFRLDRVF